MILYIKSDKLYFLSFDLCFCCVIMNVVAYRPHKTYKFWNYVFTFNASVCMTGCDLDHAIARQQLMTINNGVRIERYT